MNNYLNTASITDDEALRKANSITWFDQSKKKESKSARKQVQDMTNAELESELIRNTERLDTFAKLPKELRPDLKDKVMKIAGFVSYLKIEMKKRGLLGNEIIKENPEKTNSEITKLRRQVTHLENQNKLLRKSNACAKEQRKLENIKVARDREVLIHMNFKKLIKEYLGEPEYMVLIRQASEIADQAILDGEQ